MFELHKNEIQNSYSRKNYIVQHGTKLDDVYGLRNQISISYSQLNWSTISPFWIPINKS